MAKRLTDIGIRNLKPAVARREIADVGQRGLYVVLQPSGRRGFAVRYRFNGKPHKLTLTGGLSLAAARKAAAAAMWELEQGRDPAATRKAAKAKATAADTLQAICEEYLKREGPRLRTVDQRHAVLRRLVYPTLGNRLIDGIRRTEINRLLDKVEDENGPAQADRVLGFLGRIFNWHASRSDDFRSPIVRGMARTKQVERARSRILTDDELRRVWQAAGDAGMFGALMRFLLLSAARRSEASGLRWSEISVDGWLLPAARNKTKVDLLRPLSRAARSLLAELPRFADCEYGFTWRGRLPLTGFSKPKRELDAASGVVGWVIHDLRRCSRSLLSRAGVSADVAERCLGHVIPGVRGTYDRHQYQAEMAHAYEALAGLIERIVGGPQANVVALRGRPSE